MYLTKSINHATFTTILFSIALFGGIVLGILIPLPWINRFFPVLANFTFQFILYFTIPYLFFSLLISSYELHKSKQLIKIFFLIIKTGFIITASLLLSTMLTFLFIPNQNIISLVSHNSPIPPITIATIIQNIFSVKIAQTNYASQVLIIPFFILAIILGSSANKVVNIKHPLLETCNALRTINLKILEGIFPWLSIPIVIMSIRNIASIRPLKTIVQFYPLLLFLIVLIFLLTFVIYPLLIKRFKIPIFYKTWCQQIIPTIASAFAGGNMAVASVSLLYVDDLNNSKQKITDTTITLSFIFARAGTAITIALSYIIINKNYTAIPLGITQLVLIFFLSILFSLLTNTISTPIIITGIATMSQIPNLLIQDLYLSITPLVIILHSLASVIDIVTCAFIKLYVVQTAISQSQLQMQFATPRIT